MRRLITLLILLAGAVMLAGCKVESNHAIGSDTLYPQGRPQYDRWPYNGRVVNYR